jgi:protein AaeX
MFGDVALFGVYLPKLLALAVLALVLHSIGKRILGHVNAYRLIWHPALFNLSLFVVIFAATAYVFQRYAS